MPLWQCPQFLFVVLGIFICLAIVVSYLVGAHYIQDPAVMALVTLFLTGFLLIIDFLIVRSFERLAEANKMKSEFVSVVSHQLRSPISNLSWTLEVLTSGKVGEVREEQLEYFTILKENIVRMKELASNLLVVSRIETLTLPIELSSFQLGEVTETVVERYRTFAQASNVKIEINKEPDLPPVWGDPEKIKMVIENLLDNAIRYSDKKGTVEKGWRKTEKRFCGGSKTTESGYPGLNRNIYSLSSSGLKMLFSVKHRGRGWGFLSPGPWLRS